jgi:hypothetical protein
VDVAAMSAKDPEPNANCLDVLVAFSSARQISTAFANVFTYSSISFLRVSALLCPAMRQSIGK